MKKYLNISEVSKIIGLKEHVIRYWDSVDPKTNKIRIEGISTKSKGGTRYFNKSNLNKLKNLKNLIYQEGQHYPSLKLADKILNSKRLYLKDTRINKNSLNINKTENSEKIAQILKNMRKMLK